MSASKKSKSQSKEKNKSKKRSKSSQASKVEDTMNINFVWSEQVKMATNRLKRQLQCPMFAGICALPGVLDPKRDIQIPELEVIYGDVIWERKCLKKAEEKRRYDPASLEMVVRNFASRAFIPKRFIVESDKKIINEEVDKSKDEKDKKKGKKNEKKKIDLKNSSKKSESEEANKSEVEKKPEKVFKTPCTVETLCARLNLFPELFLTESSLSLISNIADIPPKSAEKEPEVKSKKKKK